MALVKEIRLLETIQLQKINKTLLKNNQKITLLPECSLSVKQGEMLAITGQSGIGKSTLLNIIGCLDEASVGKYHLDGHDITQLPARQKASLRNERFGFIFQQYLLIRHLSVLENVALTLQYRNLSYQKSLEEAENTLSELGLGDHLQHLPGELSGGQQQRTSLARAIVTNPKILLADEPTGALDDENSHRMMSTLVKINRERNTTIIMVTHDQSMAQYCHRITPIDTLFHHQAA